MKAEILAVLFLALNIVGCISDDNTEIYTTKIFGIFTVNNDGLSAEVEGTIIDVTLQDFNDMTAQYPNLKTLNLVDVPGSDVSGNLQTDAALELGREVGRDLDALKTLLLYTFKFYT